MCFSIFQRILLLVTIVLFSSAMPVAALPQLLKDINQQTLAVSSNPGESVMMNGVAYFATNDGNTASLYRSDATSAGTYLIKAFSMTGATTGGADVRSLTVVGNTLFFTVWEQASGIELWKSDGTAIGTVLVKDINTQPGIGSGNTASSAPVYLTAMGNLLFFMADDGIHGSELWKSDGTAAGTVLVADINVGSIGGTISRPILTPMGGVLYFTADDGIHGGELWKSDGTAAGTVLVADINTQPGATAGSTQGSYPSQLTAMGGKVFFSAKDGTGAWGLWVSDGSTQGTQKLTGTSPGHLTSAGNMLFFAGGSSLWRTDGTLAGTLQLTTFQGTIREIIANANSVYVSTYYAGGFYSYSSSSLIVSDGTVAGTSVIGGGGTDLTLAGSRLFFIGSGGSLWTSDGTAAGTIMLRGGGWRTLIMAAIGNTLFFGGEDAAGLELWKSDGTAVGTVLVKDINPVGDSTPSQLVSVNTMLLFAANDGTHGVEPWVTDGTAAGTFMLANVAPEGQQGSNITEVMPVGGQLFFVADDGVHGSELWVSDLTGTGTRMVVDINVQPPSAGTAVSAGSNPSGLVKSANYIFFRADDGTTGEAWWRSDGTAAGTVKLVDDTSQALWVAAINDTLYFSFDDGVNGRELWKSNGITTTMVKDLYPGTYQKWVSYPWGGGGMADYPNSSGPQAAFDVIGDTFYFSASTDAGKTGLWKSDGTAAGTVLLKGFSSMPAYACRMGNEMYFFVDEGIGGLGLWKTDSTPSGTTLAAGGLSTSGVALPRKALVIDRVMFFALDDVVHGTELWKSDGTAAGTMLVKDIYSGASPWDPLLPADSTPLSFRNVGGVLYFTADDGVHGRELWRSDGTANGTVLVKDINGNPSDSAIGAMATVGNMLYFTADDGVHGRELWRSDGTANGTVLVKDINPTVDQRFGRPNSAFSNGGVLYSIGGALFFAADDGVNGIKTWVSNGSSAGTFMLQGMEAFAGSSGSSYFVPVGSTVFFTATTSTYGAEPWVLPLASLDAGGVNFPPAPADANLQVQEDVAGQLQIQANDINVADSHTYAVVVLPRYGVAAVDVYGQLGYSASLPNWNGQDDFVVEVTDNSGASARMTVNVQVLSVNDPPSSTLANIVTDEDTVSAETTPSVTDVDVSFEGDSHIFTIVTQPSYGTAQVVNNQLVYTPFTNYNGTDSFTFRATDTGGLFVDGTATVTVNPVNDPPMPFALPISTTTGTSASTYIAPNDPDIGDTHSYLLMTPPGMGTATVDATLGLVTYTPNAGFTGTDFFLVNVTDASGLSGVASVFVLVNAAGGSMVDTVAPSVSLNGTNPLIITQGGSFVDPGATWTDNVDGSGPVANVIGTVDVNIPGNYTLIYSYIDMAGNMGTAIRTVIVQASNANNNLSAISAGGGGGGCIVPAISLLQLPMLLPMLGMFLLGVTLARCKRDKPDV